MSTLSDQAQPAAPAGPQLVEVLYESERTRVSRVARSDAPGTVIRKERLGPGSVERAQGEIRVLHRLAAVSGVPRLATGRGADELLFDDSHAVTLAALIGATGAPDTGTCVEWALELANTISAVHQAGVVHRDINPSNILISGPDRRPLLIDFDLASTFGQERPGFADHREIVGTLPYLAPEQTGRTGMTVDERADLYGLGATLYEVATGQPPFPIGDPMRMVRDTLATLPTPPAARDARISQQLSDIIMRLLEKEPDRRYQGAEGLSEDLRRLRDDLAAGWTRSFELGDRDFPLRLSAPSRLVGRGGEIATLKSSLHDAMTGGGRVVLVSGGPGVGKTALVGELRSLVTDEDGWLVAGKFDQYRQDFASTGIIVALRALGRLLLAGSETELHTARSRIVKALGTNLPILAGLPEYAALMQLDFTGVPAHTPGDAMAGAARQLQAVLDLLRTVASPQRPVVFAIDDLHWAGPIAVAFIDGVLSDAHLDGLLLVGSYRDGEVSPSHPLAAALSRWESLGIAPTRVELSNLPSTDVGELLGEMLRLRPDEVAGLAAAIGERSAGNPFDTVELVNALRRAGALIPGESGWSWDEAAIRRFVGQGDVVDLLAARIDRLAEGPRELLEVMAFVGGELELGLLTAAAGLTGTSMVRAQLIPLLEDGLLVSEQGDPPAVRFPHDRVQQAAYGRLNPEVRRDLHLTIARRMAAVPGAGGIAAKQYLWAIDGLDDPAIADPAERRVAAELFVGAASMARELHPVGSEQFLTAAVRVLRGRREPADSSQRQDPLLIKAERQRHAVLYSLGRLVEADAMYEVIQASTTDPIELVEPVCFQILSLTNRGRPREAIELGMVLLRRLGIAVPQGDFSTGAGDGHDEMRLWVSTLDVAADIEIPESVDPQGRAAAILLNALVTPSYFCEKSITVWLFATSRRMWVENGPCAPLVAMLSGAATTTIMLWEDYSTGYSLARHVVAVGKAREYEPETSYAGYIFTLTARLWFEPLQDLVHYSQNAREGLVRLGDLQMACFTYFLSIVALIDCSPSLDSGAAEVESALAFASRTGNDYCTAAFVSYRQFVRALRGETNELGGFTDGEFDEAEHVAAIAANPMAVAQFHIHRALSAAVFNDSSGLAHHAAAATELLTYVVGFHAVAMAHLVQGLALAERARAAGPAERPALVVELEQTRDWMIDRAADAPGNFGHLATLLDAEHAWATGDLDRAARAFDAARLQLSTRQRPWHQALITERAALFHLNFGLEQTGRDLLAVARRHYLAWCATGKVRQLDEEYPFLRGTALRRSPENASRTPSLAGSSRSGDDLDLLAILRASQTLSSETSLDRLRSRLGELLKAMTGATTVLIALRGYRSDDWRVWDTSELSVTAVPLEMNAAAGLLPISAFRYAERIREPLLIYDATKDERFARDPYLTGMERCSLLIVPLVSQGVLRAVLMLENRFRKGAFAADGLDAVMLIAGQLTVSLDNARLYASLERKVAERTDALEEANRKLESLSNTDALTRLPNRRQFDSTLDAEWQRAVRQGTSLGLAMIDVDHFKLYNDHYGHLAGDECLRSIATALSDGVRTAPDLVCRYGGEEFAAILPGADEAVSLRVAERMRAAVAALQKPHAGQGADGGAVTVSIGVAAHIGGASTTSAELIAAADRALYQAKSGGRNRIRPSEWETSTAADLPRA